MEGISEEERVATHESWDKIIRWGHRRDYKNREAEDVLGKTNKVAVMGGGSFGTAMATLLARNKDTLDVVILVRSQADADAINDTHRNAEVPPSTSSQIHATVDPAKALGGRLHRPRRPGSVQQDILGGREEEHIDPETPLLCLSKVWRWVRAR